MLKTPFFKKKIGNSIRGTLTSTKIPSLSNDTMAGSSEGTNLKRMRKDLQIKVCRTKGKSIEIIEPTEIQLSIDQNGQIADLYGGSKSRIWVNSKQKGPWTMWIGRQFFCLCALASINKKSELHLHTTMNFQKSNPIFISTYLLNTQWTRYRNSNPLQRAEQSKRHLKIYYRLFILNVCNTKICMKKRRKKVKIQLQKVKYRKKDAYGNGWKNSRGGLSLTPKALIPSHKKLIYEIGDETFC